MSNNNNSNYNDFPKHAWFSQKAKIYNKIKPKSPNIKETYISHIYLDQNGQEIEVTAVGHQKDFKYKWDDKIYMGKVTQWVRNINAREMRGI